MYRKFAPVLGSPSNKTVRRVSNPKNKHNKHSLQKVKNSKKHSLHFECSMKEL